MRSHVLFVLSALFISVIMAYTFVAQPGYTDAFYYVNAANRLVSGAGLTDGVLWTYIGASGELPAPAHAYWMPMPSLLAAFGMWVLRAPLSYDAAQWPFVVLAVIAGCVAYGLGWHIGKTRRHAWAAGLMVVFGGYYARFWGMTTTFAPYAAFGSLCLVCLGLGTARKRIVWFAGAGVLAALAHLTRADGVLLLLVGGVVLLWPWDRRLSASFRLAGLGLLVAAYLLTMAPWVLRNLNVIGVPLPSGGAQGIWYTEYDDIFNYPPDASPATFFAEGPGILWSSRWRAFANNLGTFWAVEGMLFLAPLMLLGFWVRRRDGFLRPFWIYALGLHLAMTFAFPFPGYRGGLFHSASSLMPFWTALAIVGLDTLIDAIATRRPRWNPATAKPVFTIAAVFGVVILSLNVGWGGRTRPGVPNHYIALDDALPPDARVMVNDPSALYYHTGRYAVVLPNEEPAIILEIASEYDITHLLLEGVQDDVALAATRPLINLPSNPPEFLRLLPFSQPGMRLYAIEPS